VPVALFVLHKKCMYSIILSSAACLVPTYFFFILSHKRYNFREWDIVREMCLLIFSTTSVRNISHSKKNSRKCHKCTDVFL